MNSTNRKNMFNAFSIAVKLVCGSDLQIYCRWRMKDILENKFHFIHLQLKMNVGFLYQTINSRSLQKFWSAISTGKNYKDVGIIGVYNGWIRWL